MRESDEEVGLQEVTFSAHSPTAGDWQRRGVTLCLPECPSLCSFFQTTESTDSFISLKQKKKKTLYPAVPPHFIYLQLSSTPLKTHSD